jgi:Branched-chain amino acid transport system / permease component/Tannase and feruloyl esterase
MLASGLTIVLGNAWFHRGRQTPSLRAAARFMPIDLPGAAAAHDMPLLGLLYDGLVGGHNLIVYAALAAVPLTHWVVCRTRFGLRLRAVGKNPQVVDTAGISVSWLRYRAVLLCGLLTGIAGTYLALAQNAGFSREMTAGQGYIALAALIFGKWRPYAPSRLLAVQKPAIAASDVNDGVLDGIIDDPRTCHFDASANICGNPNAPAAPDCLTTAEATAFNKIWDGPRNEKGNRIWFPLDRGSDFAILDGLAPFQLGVIQFEWDEKDPSYAAGIQLGSLFGPPPPSRVGHRHARRVGPGLSAASRARGLAQHRGRHEDDDLVRRERSVHLSARCDQLLSSVGGALPNGSRSNRLRRSAELLSLVPRDGCRPLRHPRWRFWPRRQPGRYWALAAKRVDFDALVDWVERGIAPSQVIGQSSGPAAIPVSRPRCPYPQTAQYIGSGDIYDAANWGCGGKSGNATGHLSRYTGSV